MSTSHAGSLSSSGKSSRPLDQQPEKPDGRMCEVDSEAQWAGVGWRNVADVEMQLRWLEWCDRLWLPAEGCNCKLANRNEEQFRVLSNYFGACCDYFLCFFCLSVLILIYTFLVQQWCCRNNKLDRLIDCIFYLFTTPAINASRRTVVSHSNKIMTVRTVR